MHDYEALVQRATGASSWRARRVQSLWSGYGEILRLELDGAQVHGEPISSVIVKRVGPPAAASSSSASVRRSHERKLRSYDVELTFYSRYSSDLTHARVPRLWGSERSGHGWIFILEDLDAAGFTRRPFRLDDAEVTACLRWLAGFHAHFLGAAPSNLWKVGTYWHLATRPDELAALRDPLLRRAAPVIDARLNAARHRTLVHGDAKLENFCFSRAKNGDVAAVDFQYVGGGVGVKDVAYLLGCLSPTQRHAQPWLDVYFRELRDASSHVAETHARAETAPDFDDLELEWRELFPFAVADFHRFLSGWAGEEAAADSEGERVTRDLLASLAREGAI